MGSDSRSPVDYLNSVKTVHILRAKLYVLFLLAGSCFLGTRPFPWCPINTSTFSKFLELLLLNTPHLSLTPVLLTNMITMKMVPMTGTLRLDGGLNWQYWHPLLDSATLQNPYHAGINRWGEMMGLVMTWPIDLGLAKTTNTENNIFTFYLQ